MSKVIERCAGIDIGKRFLLCCALTGAAAEEPQSETLRFEATVAALQKLREWLASKKVTHVVGVALILDINLRQRERPSVADEVSILLQAPNGH